MFFPRGSRKLDISAARRCPSIFILHVVVYAAAGSSDDKSSCHELPKESLKANAMLQVNTRSHIINHTDQELVHNQFRHKYTRLGRQPSHVSRGEILLDFEVQYGGLGLTPDVLLDSLYSVAFPHRSCESHGPPFGHVSHWFTLGTDGASLVRQKMSAQLEATSASFMRPMDVLESDFLPDLQNFVDRTNVAGASIPGTAGAVTMHQGTRVWMQYTVGLSLAEVPILMNNSESQSIWLRTNTQCSGKPMLYKALVSLAAMTVRGVAGDSVTKCKHAKRYLHPWLVRTHFGDLAKYVASQIGSDILQELPQDVLAVAQVSPSAQAFPAGVTDYLHMLEVAEVAGLMTATPTTSEQVCDLARHAIQHKKSVKSLLQGLGCGVHGFNVSGIVKSGLAQKEDYLSAIASPSQWLEGILQGRDLWTDRESIVSRSSKTNLIFKSMGSWRMASGSGAGHIYLECVAREKKKVVRCLGGESSAVTVSERMREVAKRIQSLPWGNLAA